MKEGRINKWREDGGSRMDRELFDYLMHWLGLHDEWQTTLLSGANAPRRTDGQILNGIRNRMICLLADMENSGYSLDYLLQEAAINGFELDSSVKELPPIMDVKYMKDADDIRRNAKEAWKIYTSSEDYQYLKENIDNLCDGFDTTILHRLKNDIAFVDYLKLAIEKEYLPKMRKYSDIKRYMNQLRWARDLLAMRIDRIQPFHEEM